MVFVDVYPNNKEIVFKSIHPSIVIAVLALEVESRFFCFFSIIYITVVCSNNDFCCGKDSHIVAALAD